MVLRIRSEYGQSLAWSAVLFATVFVPLLILVVDGSRLFRVRSVLQTATDAGCEAVTDAVADIDTFRMTGETTLYNRWHWRSWRQGQIVFNDIVEQSNNLDFSARFSTSPNYDNAFVSCQGRATVPLILGGGSIQIKADSVSSIRFSNK